MNVACRLVWTELDLTDDTAKKERFQATLQHCLREKLVRTAVLGPADGTGMPDICLQGGDNVWTWSGEAFPVLTFVDRSQNVT